MDGGPAGKNRNAPAAGVAKVGKTNYNENGNSHNQTGNQPRRVRTTSPFRIHYDVPGGELVKCIYTQTVFDAC